ASKEADKAIDKLEEARKELEKRLKQLREEEMERLLANLEARCKKMLAMQIEVYEGTKRVHSIIEGNADKKPTRNELQKSVELGVREGDIIKECTTAMRLLEEEGSAVAFYMAFEDVRKDMFVVEARLNKADVAPFTQKVEEDIIAALKEMILALQKAQQDLKNNKNSPPPPPGQPPPQKLLDLLAELKLIRSLQMRINRRTTDYGNQYTGEQADE